jgi:carboxypeptidase Taq
VPDAATVPPELTALRVRAEELASLARVQALLFWDQNTMMPPRGAPARGDHQAALETISHRKHCSTRSSRGRPARTRTRTTSAWWR